MPRKTYTPMKASEILKHVLTPDQKFYLTLIRQLVKPSNIELLQSIFKILDRDDNGKLDKDDFTVPDNYKAGGRYAQIENDLKKVWSTIRVGFDFDGDYEVSLIEFIDGFLLNTYLQIKTTGCDETQSFAYSFEEWVNAFNKQFQENLSGFQEFISEASIQHFVGVKVAIADRAAATQAKSNQFWKLISVTFALLFVAMLLVNIYISGRSSG